VDLHEQNPASHVRIKSAQYKKTTRVVFLFDRCGSYRRRLSSLLALGRSFLTALCYLAALSNLASLFSLGHCTSFLLRELDVGIVTRARARQVFAKTFPQARAYAENLSLEIFSLASQRGTLITLSETTPAAHSHVFLFVQNKNRRTIRQRCLS